MNLPKVPHDFVIRYLDGKSYFKRIEEGRVYFGASLLDTPKFMTLEAAQEVLRKFSPVSRTMCDVVPRRK